MQNKSSVELSDVQLKVIEELDVLTDAFVSTFNEIGKMIKAFSEEISILTDNFIKEKSDWRPYDTQCFDLSYKPFREYIIERKFAIESLKQYFNVGGQSTLVKEVNVGNKKKQVDVIVFSWGFTYDIEEEPSKLFYIELYKEKKSADAIFSKNDYDKLGNEIKKLCGIKEGDFYDLEHPDDGDSERFFVWLDFDYLDKVSDFFQICKDDLVEKFLSKIND